MKKYFLILLVALLATLFISVVWPKELIAEMPVVDLEAQKVAMQNEDRLFNKIAYCESKNDPLADNPYSSAKGRFQFLDGTWKHYAPKLWGDSWMEKNVLNYKDNTDLAWFVYTNYGTRDWEADPKSYDCWKGEIANGLYKNIY